MDQLIHQTQTYHVPRRFITDNVSIIWDDLDVSRLLGLDANLIFLNQEVAFDWVDCHYLCKVL